MDLEETICPTFCVWENPEKIPLLFLRFYFRLNDCSLQGKTEYYPSESLENLLLLFFVVNTLIKINRKADA